MIQESSVRFRFVFRAEHNFFALLALLAPTTSTNEYFKKKISKLRAFII